MPTHPEPAWQKMAPLNGTTQAVDIEEERLCPTMDRQWLHEGDLYVLAISCFINGLLQIVGERIGNYHRCGL